MESINRGFARDKIKNIYTYVVKPKLQQNEVNNVGNIAIVLHSF